MPRKKKEHMGPREQEYARHMARSQMRYRHRVAQQSAPQRVASVWDLARVQGVAA